MTEVLQWIDADGVTTTLEVDWDVSGRYMPKIQVESDGVPGQPGELLRSARHGVHEFMLTVWVHAAGEAALLAALRDLVDKMDPTRGPGKIRTTSPIPDQREIGCYYAAGLEVVEKLGDSSGPDSQKLPIAFAAYDPYWYDVSPTSQTFTVDTVPSFFPIFPIKLTASEIVVDSTVTNDGSVETWPVWTVTGPGSAMKLINLTTGAYLYFPSTSLGTGQFITIDTRPGVKSVVLDDGTNVYSWLDPSSTLWPLRRGVNSVRLEMTGAAPLVSSLQVSYWQRYLSP